MCKQRTGKVLNALDGTAGAGFWLRVDFGWGCQWKRGREKPYMSGYVRAGEKYSLRVPSKTSVSERMQQIQRLEGNHPGKEASPANNV